jgi:hypothetical protein
MFSYDALDSCSIKFCFESCGETTEMMSGREDEPVQQKGREKNTQSWVKNLSSVE